LGATAWPVKEPAVVSTPGIITVRKQDLNFDIGAFEY
jgi:hypothetical protein